MNPNRATSARTAGPIAARANGARRIRKVIDKLDEIIEKLGKPVGRASRFMIRQQVARKILHSVAGKLVPRVETQIP